MTINSQVFVPTEEIRKLTRGSYEQLIVKLTEAAEPFLIEVYGDVSWEIVSTFANHALVLGENGECYRVQYEKSKDGGVKVLGTAKYPVKTVTESSYIKTEARKIVDAFIAGAMTEATERFSELVQKVPAKKGVADDRIVEAVRERLTAPRPWKTQFAQRATHFKTFLGESKVSEIMSASLTAHFSPLYESEIQTADVGTYYTVVQEAFSDLSTKIESLQHELEDSVESLKTLTAAIAELGESEVLTALDIFAQDLLSDIRSIHKVVHESIHQVSGVDNLGRIYDSIAENFSQYEVAVRFVVEMTKSLSEANK